MRIRRADLENQIIEKLDQLDNITSLPYIDGEGFVSYDKDKGFYFKKTNDTYLKKIYDENDFLDMENAVYHPAANVKSSAYTDMRVDKARYSAAVSSLIVDAKYKGILDMADAIRLFKHKDNRFIAMDISGNVIEVMDNAIRYSINIVMLLRNTFSFSELEPFDVTDIEIIDDGFMVSVIQNGVYKYNFKTATVEMVLADTGVKMIQDLNDAKVFCVSDNAVTINMRDSGKKIETYHTIKNAYQIPFLMRSEGRDIFIIGKTMIRNSDKLVHLWREDIAKVNYNNKDGALSTHKSASEYEIRFASIDKNYLYISGLYRNKLFIWKYDRDYLHREPEEILMDCLDFSGITGVICHKNQYLVTIGNMLYGIQDNLVALNMRFDDPLAKIELTEYGIFGISQNHLVKIEIPEFIKAQEIIEYSLLDEQEECNNMDIIVCGVKNEKIELYGEDGKQIIPTATFSNRGATMMKLLGCHDKKISMKLYVNQDSMITGIAIRKNMMFVR